MSVGDVGESALLALSAYYRALVQCLHRGDTYQSLAAAQPMLPPEARLHVYQLCLHVRLWNSPHYRSGTFGNDVRKNLRNVALPGTGVALSIILVSRLAAIFFLWIGVPAAAAVASFLAWRRGATQSPSSAFGQFLFASGEQGRAWFHYWRLNCTLASYHALRTSDPGYALEDKLTFLQACESHGVPVTPWFRSAKVVVKHRNEEGGLGMHTFTNADAGGDWIIQAWLGNAEGIARLLPTQAPLSTLRLVTASKACARANPADGARTDDSEPSRLALTPTRALTLTRILTLTHTHTLTLTSHLSPSPLTLILIQARTLMTSCSSPLVSAPAGKVHTHTHPHSTYTCTHIHMRMHTHAHTFTCACIHMHTSSCPCGSAPAGKARESTSHALTYSPTYPPAHWTH